jgi:glycosyltransferase involved in cell wall biosynthesis
VIYRVAKRCERWFFREADAVVTLTASSVPQIRRWLQGRDVSVTVIPTCVELERFSSVSPRPNRPGAVWCGSLGTFYRFDLAIRFAAALDLPLTVLTRQTELARTQLDGRTADVREVPPDQVPSELHPGDIGLCFIADGFANLARAPTRFAEYLAAGLVVAVTPGVGDFDEILREHRVGVRIDDLSERGMARTAQQALELARDPTLPERGRELARRLYAVDAGARAYLDLYRQLQRHP